MANTDGSNSGPDDSDRRDEEVDRYPIVGIGASAGGLEAFKRLLQALPADPGMAFVLIPHLDPEHRSLMAEILTRISAMPVLEANDEPLIERNHVYVIPPNRTMLVTDGHLKLTPREALHGQHRSIDAFLRSLAENQTDHAIGVILSGTGTDGTLGLEAIKAQGGITFAQDDSAQQDSMPRSAVAAGCVDFVLPPEAIAAELARIARHPYVALGNGSPSEVVMIGEALATSEFNKVLQLLQQATGVDFSGYKATTLKRRIERRMLLQGIEGIGDYLRLLQAETSELQNLSQDVLISVTAFFREPECFDTIKHQILPEIFRNRMGNAPVRMWVPGCASGEEAYSLAIIIAEFASEQGIEVPTQIFATDLNEQSIGKARLGLYSKNIQEDVSAERLNRFFVETEGGFQVVKRIREMCVFARQNVLADPPFSQLDLISCRNLLIYLEPAFQKRLLPLLHYAIKPAGFLWLGSSESTAGFANLFETIEPKQKLFKRLPGGSITSVGMVAPVWEARPFAGVRSRPLESSGLDLQREADRIVLTKYAPPGVILNAEFEVQQFRGDTTPYLAQAPGRPTLNVLKMAREGLLVALQSALQKVRLEGHDFRQEGIRVKFEGGVRIVNLAVQALKTADPARGFLVLFEDVQAIPTTSGTGPAPAPPALLELDAEVARLNQELVATREYMQSLIEQQEASNEELQSANEEIQSSNEELQSVNEELQTSKEEVQSSNEELTTVNDELLNRNEQLDRAHNNLNNFIASSQLPMVMVGTDLRIRRFSAAAEKLLNLISADLGRRIGDFRFPLELQDLERWLAETITHATSREREVQDRAGHWYSFRTHPYRTSQKTVDGAVIVLVDIDGQKHAQEEIRVAEEKYRLLVEGAIGYAIMLLDDEGKVATWNVGAERTFGYTATEIIGQPFAQFLLPEDHGGGRLQRELEQARRDGAVTEDTWLVRRDGTRFWATGVTTALRDDAGAPRGFAKVVRDITDKKRAEESRRQEDRRKDEFLATLAHELRNPLAPLANTLELLSRSNRDADAIDHGLRMMGRQVEKLKRLVADILDVARMTSGRVELQRELVDLRTVVERAIETEGHEIATAREKLTLNLPADPVWVEGDALRLEQSVANLLHNAAKYTEPGGQIRLTLEVLTGGDEPNAREAILCVQDTGIGIQADQLTQIFEFFARGDRSYASRNGGLGVGLSLVKGLIELHGGRVEAHSEGVGKGSEFVICLPLSSPPAAEQADLPDPSPSAVERPAGRSAQRILIVDDNLDAAEVLADLLSLLGHQVEIAHSGPEALVRAASVQPQVIILDIGMPGMDGYEVAQRLRQQPDLGRTRLVALSGYGGEEDRRRSREAGFNLHLVKPVDIDALNHAIAAAQNADSD